MFWQRTFQSLDVHCEGEVGRIISAGVLDIPGATMAEKLAYLNEEDTSLREFFTSEPRCNAAGSIVLLPPKSRPEADSGFIVLQPDQAHAMSGSNAICATTALLEGGFLPMQEGETLVRLDTAAGLVEARADCAQGRCQSVTLNMPPAFVDRLDFSFSSAKFGKITCDIAFGGVFYALVPASCVGLDIAPENARQLAEAGQELLAEISALINPVHPQHPQIHGLAYVMFYEKHEGFHRTCTCMKPGRLDRSPCGTGSTALVTSLYARGMLQAGSTYQTRSIINSQFGLRISGAQPENSTVSVEVTGRAWLYGISQWGLDPNDPYPQGFRLADIWGDVGSLTGGNPTQ